MRTILKYIGVAIALLSILQWAASPFVDKPAYSLFTALVMMVIALLLIDIRDYKVMQNLAFLLILASVPAVMDLFVSEISRRNAYAILIHITPLIFGCGMYGVALLMQRKGYVEQRSA